MFVDFYSNYSNYCYYSYEFIYYDTWLSECPKNMYVYEKQCVRNCENKKYL